MKCLNEECYNDVPEGYRYCKSCYTKWKTLQGSQGEPAPPDRTPKKWDADPIIDVLLKINDNLRRINKTLEERHEVWNNKQHEERYDNREDT